MRHVVSLVAAAALIGCVVPSVVPSVVPAPRVAQSSALSLRGAPQSRPDTVRPPVVQVRSYPQASSITVLAWNADDAAYGLRTQVRRDGSLVGSNDGREHVLYMSPEFLVGTGGLGQASVGLPVPPGLLLAHTGLRRDADACHRSEQCAPAQTVGLVIPDRTLRAHRDSLVVSFVGPGIHSWSLTLGHDLIERYLQTVDSVGTALRR